MRKFIQEFEKFINRGNVMDMAVGVILGGAFGKIVSSVVADIIMPPIGLLIGGVSFVDLKLVLKAASVNAAGEVIPAVTVNYGNFLQTLFDFLIISFSIFMMVKFVNELTSKKEEKPEEPAAPPAPTKEEVLLTEIRDLLKEKDGK